MRPSRECLLVRWNARLKPVPEHFLSKELNMQLLSMMHTALLIENPCAFLSSEVLHPFARLARGSTEHQSKCMLPCRMA